MTEITQDQLTKPERAAVEWARTHEVEWIGLEVESHSRNDYGPYIDADEPPYEIITRIVLTTDEGDDILLDVHQPTGRLQLWHYYRVLRVGEDQD
jgi:hypothetical protein